MKRRLIHTRGLVLKRIGFSDSSQIVTLFTKELGIVSVMAKGALRLSRRSSSFPAPFDLAGWYDLVFRVGSGDIHLAHEARLIEGFDHLRRQIPVFLDACLALDVIPRMFQHNDPHPGFLRASLSYLKLLGANRGRRSLRIHFIAQLLQAGGFAPFWGGCGECGAVLGPDARLRLPYGALCSDCARGGDRPVSLATIHYLDAEHSAPWERVPALDPGSDVSNEAWSTLRQVLLHHLERAPRALRYVRD